MTRFRICVNPESRDTPRVHARRGKAFRILSLRGVHLHIGAAVFTPSAYADDEKEENEGVLKWKWGINRSVRNDSDTFSFPCCFAQLDEFVFGGCHCARTRRIERI